ncbi:MAG: XRE family transcriptional regulator [Proteobacteria bacterium]|nr:XRE family transcriptional regulator [Pseudomonadota bacterium]MCH8302319.1 XRE family transcriptional regulator [Pseudomonadota bacterium]
MTSITRGNVFEDLGFSPEEAERMALQVFLGEQIRTFINRNKLGQAKAAAFFGVQQPKISKILNENLDGMSIDYLVKMVAHTGGTFNYSFRQPRKMSRKEVELRVAAA